MIRPLIQYFTPFKLKTQTFEFNEVLEKRKKAEVAIWYALTSSIVVAFLFFVRLFLEGLNSGKSLLFLPLFCVLMLGILFFIKISQKVYLSSHIIMTLSLLTTLIRVLTTGGITSVTVVWLVAIPLLAVFMISRKAGFFFLGLIFFILIALSLSVSTEVFLSPVATNQYTSAVVIFTTTSFVFALAYFYDKERELGVEKIRSYEKNLSKSKKLAALGSLVGGLAHEVNNPLAIVKGKLHIMDTVINRGEVNPIFLQDQMSSINIHMNRIESIINAFKTYSRDDYSLTDTDIDLSHIIANSIQEVEDTEIAKKIKIINECTQPLYLYGNKNLLQRVFVNLIKNSIDALEDHHNPWIKLQCSTLNEQKISIYITDAGSGISKDIISKIMEPFFTTKEIGRGTGIGLNLSYNIIKQHKGDLVINTEHENTQFIITLPLNKKEPELN